MNLITLQNTKRGGLWLDSAYNIVLGPFHLLSGVSDYSC